MQWIAMLTMLIDHIGVVFYQDQTWLRYIGRIAFPLYAYLIVVGYQRTRNYRNYMIRVGLLAIIAQPAYQWAFNTTGLNIIISLFIGLLLFKLLDISAKYRLVQILIVLATLYGSTFFDLDYGAYGIVLMLIFRYVPRDKLMLFHAILELPYIFVWGYQYVSLIVTYFISFQAKWLAKADTIQVPRWLWRCFYPLHLYILALMNYNF